MNLRQRTAFLVFQTSSVLIGYSRRIESKRRQICSSVHTKGRWMLGSQKPPSSSGLLRKETILRKECFGVFTRTPSYVSQHLSATRQIVRPGKSGLRTRFRAPLAQRSFWANTSADGEWRLF